MSPQDIKSCNIEQDDIDSFNSSNHNNSNNITNNKNNINNNFEDNITSTNDPGQNSPFNKLAEALNVYRKQKKFKTNELDYNMTVEQFFRTVIESYLQKWMDENLKKIVEQIVLKEVEKLKSE